MDSPFSDLYRILWYFERAEMTIRFKLVDPAVFFEAAGFHCWWWGQLLRKVDGPKAEPRHTPWHRVRRTGPGAPGSTTRGSPTAPTISTRRSNWALHQRTSVAPDPGRSRRTPPTSGQAYRSRYPPRVRARHADRTPRRPFHDSLGGSAALVNARSTIARRRVLILVKVVPRWTLG